MNDRFPPALPLLPPPPPAKKKKIPERWAHLDSCSFPFCVLQVKGCLAF